MTLPARRAYMVDMHWQTDGRAYELVEPATLLSIAAWLRKIAPGYTPRACAKLLSAADLVEHHNERMAHKAARAVPSKAPERPQKVA